MLHDLLWFVISNKIKVEVASNYFMKCNIFNTKEHPLWGTDDMAKQNPQIQTKTHMKTLAFRMCMTSSASVESIDYGENNHIYDY